HSMTKQPALIQLDALWPLMTLGETQLQRLRPLLDAQSDERPEVQQLASYNHLPKAPLAPNNEATTTSSTADSAIIGDTLSDALLAVLNKFTLDITEKARLGEIDPVFGRDDEIRQMVDILSRRRK
ncbi:TPA: Clp protease ClpB, partial [Escherichia coli]|nr:Clp protease ClpB [Escherichia coli]